MNECRVEGCERVIYIKKAGLCNAHYQRNRIYGDPTYHPPRPGRGPTVHGTSTAHNNHGCRCDLCRDWYRTNAREWARANPEKRRATQWLNRYGITPEDYQRMLDNQGGGCAICARPPRGKRTHLVVDHDHVTGAVRSLLCHPCNAGIGFLDDDPDRLIAAATYLLQHSDVLGALR